MSQEASEPLCTGCVGIYINTQLPYVPDAALASTSCTTT